MAKYVFKLILVGSAAVGKTSLVHRFVENRFKMNYKQTIGADFMSKVVEYEPGETAKLTIWDIGGQDRYKVLREQFFAGTDGALIVFDLTRDITVKELDSWFNDFRKFAGKDIPFILIGNKSDLLNQVDKLIDRDLAADIAESQGGKYIETSAKTGKQVEEAFLDITKMMTSREK